MRLGIPHYLDRVVATIEDDGAGLDARGAGAAVDAVRASIRDRGGNVVFGASAVGSGDSGR
jgi:DNA-binding IclR family transcriptional regulator